MSKKTIGLSILSVFLCLIIAYVIFLRPNRTRRAETFLSVFPKQKFLQKINKKAPSWMEYQIKKDFEDLNKNGITQEALNETFKTIKEKSNSAKTSFIRYRIIDNKFYRYFPSNEAPYTREKDFEKAIKTLTQLIKLPDVDFIFSEMDGTPEFYMAKDFYLTNDEKLQAPLITRAKNKNIKYAVLVPDFVSLSTWWQRDAKLVLDYSKKVSWEKKKAAAYWRGGSHDKPDNNTGYQACPRIILSKLSQKYPEIIEAGIIKTKAMQYEDQIDKEGLIKDFSSMEDHMDYKYLPVMDGFMCTYPGYQWRLLSNSVAFKQDSDEIQWFYGALKEYEHYIPIKRDMSDLVEKINWARTYDDTAKRISDNATKFVLENLMMDDIYLYLTKVLEEYAKLQKFDGKLLKRDIENNPNWLSIQQRKKANKILLER